MRNIFLLCCFIVLNSINVKGQCFPDGNALLFNGGTTSGPNVIFGDNNFNIPNTSSVTIEAWIYYTGGNSINAVLGNSNDGGGSNGGYTLWVNSWGTTNRRLVLQTLRTSISTSDNAVPLNQWTHVAAVIVNQTTAKLFINGVQQSTTGSVNYIASNSNPNTFSIGSMPWFGTTYSYRFKGKIDEVRIWNTDRSSQLASTYNTSVPTNSSGLLGYFKMDQGVANGNNTSITTLINSVSGGANGQLSGGWSLTTNSTSNFSTSAEAVGGVLSGSTSVCGLTNSTLLTLTGYVGNIVKWQYATTSNFATPIDVTNTNNTLTVTNVSQTRYYRAILNCGYGDVYSSTATITYNSLPAIVSQNTPSQTICNFTTSSPLSIVASGTGVTYQWYSNSTPNNTGGTLITGAISSSYSPPTTSIGTKYYYCVVSGTCTPSVTSQISGAITVIGSIAGTSSGGGTICSGTSLNLFLSGNTGSIQWQSSSSLNGTYADLIGETSAILNTGNLTSSTYYRAKVTLNSCSTVYSNIQTVTVISSIPGTILGVSLICQNTTTTLNLSNYSGNIQWQSSNTINGSFTDINGANTANYTTPQLSASRYYRAKVTNGSCPSEYTTVHSVTVTPTLNYISSITGDRNLSSVATDATYSVLPVSGATSYVWDLPPGMTIISSTGPSVLVSVSSTFIGGNITVKAINGCSETLPVVLPITKQVLPLTISGSTVVCISTGSVTESYSVSPVEGATSYVWTVPGGSLITSGINTNSIEITYNTSFSRGAIRVSAIGSDGVISTGSLSVAGIELPGVITGSTQICTAGSYEYSIVAVEGATSYEWALPMGMTLQGDGSGTTISVVTNGSVSGTLSVRALSPCGSSQLQTLSISGVSRPGYIYGERIICGATSNSVDTNGNINTTSQNGVYTYSIIPVTGADSYTWSLPTGVILESGQGTRVIQVTFDSSFESGSIAVVANSLSCGSSPSRSVFVSSASVSIGGPSNICGLTSATYSVAAGVGSNYVWTLPEGMSISSGEGTNSITVSINHPINFSNNNNTVSLSFTTLCGGSKEVSLTVDCPDYSNLTNCGSTVAFNERVFTRSVSGATMYAFDIYDSTSSTLLTTYETRGNFFQFVQALSSFEFGTTYNVKVRVKRNGVYGLAGSACSITLATPVTAIQASQCNQTVNVQDRVYASSIWDGVTYAFDIYDSEGNLITTLEKISNFFRMSEFTSVYGMTYQVGVRVKRGNGFYGEQGSRCNITIAIPTTSLVVNQCGSTIDIADRIYARSVANATMYAFSIYDANGTFITELERPYNFFRITDISYILGASYQVGIRVKQGEGSYGLEGALCTITLSGPPTTAIESAQCGT
ncbi:MAG: LamG domain-containing protein, partial [Flavobacterium sp.]|nr:LamG domain-containing protein [Flavobacterium sp.]